MKLKDLMPILNLPRVAVAIFTFILVFGFQNCRQKINSLTTANGSEGVTAQRISATDLVEVEYSYALSQSSPQRGILKLDIQDSKYQLNSQTQNYCLNYDDVFELSEILKSAEICETKNTDPNAVCTMIYEVPYAKLKFRNQTVSLGESTSGCQRTDLCGQYPDVLKGYFQNLVNNAASRACN